MRLNQGTGYVGGAQTAWDSAQTLTLSGGAWGSANVSNFTSAAASDAAVNASLASPPLGAYTSATLAFWNVWSITAFCRTANAFLYTTPAGVVSLPHTPAGGSMPSDYGPLEMDYTGLPAGAPLSSAMSVLQQSTVNSVYSYNLSASSSVNLLVDASFVVSCYDGTGPGPQHNGGLVPPMGMNLSYGASAGTPQDRFPFNFSAPAFGFLSWELPVFVQVADDAASAAQATGETYAFCSSAAALPVAGSAADWSVLTMVTAVWASAAASAPLLDVLSRGATAPGVNSGPAFGVDGGFSNFTASSGGGTWSFSNGGLIFGSYLFSSERLVSGFARSAAAGAVQSLTLSDGPDCGTTTVPGGAVNACMGAPATFYYVRVE